MARQRHSKVLATYREQLTGTLRLLNESYDKVLVALAGGALGISIAFLKDIVPLDKATHHGWLLGAWMLFIASIAAGLGRLLFGIEAHRKAIVQVDRGDIYRGKPGGVYAVMTRLLHIGSALCLILGLVMLALFAYNNVSPAKT